MQVLKADWYKSKKGWASALLAVVYFVLDHVSRAETAGHIYGFLLSSKAWFPKVSPYIAPALFVLALIFFEIERRPKNRIPEKKLTILSAVYGTSPVNDLDVTEILQNQPREGLAVVISNELFGRDPAPNIFKRLKIEYSYGNRSVLTVTRPENSRLVLPEDSWLQEEVRRLTNELAAKDTPLFAASNNASPAKKPILENDPTVYFSLTNKVNHPIPAGMKHVYDTKVTVDNTGKNDALAVKIKFPVLHTGSVTFPVIPIIKSHASVTIKGSLYGPGGIELSPFMQHDISLALEAEWNSYGDINKERLDIPCEIEYQDPQQNKFIAEANVVYFAWQKEMRIENFRFWRN